MSNVIDQITTTIKNWWLYLIFGILLIAFSIWVVMTPLESYLGLAFAFSILVFANGVSHIYFSVSNRKDLDGWGWYLASGIMELIVGLILVVYPELTVVSLPFIIGFWLMFKSWFMVGTAFDLRRYGFLDWGWLLLLGIMLGILSFIMVVYPVLGGFTIVGWTAIAFLIFGISYIMLSLKLKKLKGKSLHKADDLQTRIKQEAEGFKEQLMANVQAGDEADKIKKEIERNVDDFIRDLEKGSD